MELTKLQREVIAQMRREGLDFLAGGTEEMWKNDLKYYIDDRVSASATLLTKFKKANDQVKVK